MTRRIPRSRLVAGLAVLLALAAHAAALVRNETPETVEVEGGGGDGAIAALGNAFEDMTAGRETPVPAEEITPEAPPEQVPPETQEVAEPSESQETPRTEPVETQTETPPLETARSTPEATPSETPPDAQAPARPVAQAPTKPVPQQPAQSPAQTPAQTTPSQAPTTGLAVLPPQTMTPQKPETTPVQTAQPVEPIPQEVTPQETTPTETTPQEVTPTEPVTTATLPPLPDEVEPDPDSAAPLVSRKPPNRPDDLRPTEPVQQKAPPKPKVAAAPQGSNADRTQRKGSETGSSQATAARAAQSTAKSTEAGNAALSNYRGQVFRKIARAKRGQVNIKGATVVALTIGSSGQLAGLRVARSSGSGKLDDIALAQVRRAAPFPAPPGGASQTYTVKISGSK